MGWGTGTSLMADVIETVESTVKSPKERKALYIGLIENFEDYDADNLGEIYEYPLFVEALKEYHPDWYEDEDEE